jgi:hypothetical protein
VEQSIVRKLSIYLAAGTFALACATPASAFMPSQRVITDAAAAIDGTVAVKKKYAKHRPYGWSRGRKVGWRGGMPPGQRKKYWR